MVTPRDSYGWDKAHVVQDTIVMARPGKLHAITLNGLTVVGDISVYDGVDATGTLIAVLYLRTAVTVSFQGITFLYDCKMDTGIYLDYDQAVGADLTVTFW